jgi:hypothetical protein
MAIPKRAIRGVQSIRTNSGKADIFSEPYRVFMRISALEMEKARRGKERESAMHRVREIDNRFRKIEKEKAYLLKDIGGLKTIQHSGNLGNQPDQSAGLRHKGFKIRY